jgi:hypothetical protein
MSLFVVVDSHRSFMRFKFKSPQTRCMADRDGRRLCFFLKRFIGRVHSRGRAAPFKVASTCMNTAHWEGDADCSLGGKPRNYRHCAGRGIQWSDQSVSVGVGYELVCRSAK